MNASRSTAALQKAARGFTIIEILIVVAIIAILVAVALPSYQEYVLRGKITEATSTLSDLRLRAEKFFGDNRGYVDGGGTTFNTATPGTRYFTYACVITATTFTCTASGVPAQGMSGFQYTIDQSNARTSTFTSRPGWVNSTTCWVSKKGETC